MNGVFAQEPRYRVRDLRRGVRVHPRARGDFRRPAQHRQRRARRDRSDHLRGDVLGYAERTIASTAAAIDAAIVRLSSAANGDLESGGGQGNT